MKRGSLRGLVTIVATLLIVVGCSSSSGLPTAPGRFDIKDHSLTWDGREYEFYWADGSGQLHRASGDNFKMVEDTRTFLEVGNGDPVIHLAQEEPVTVRGEDRNGSFTTSWFPFFLGTMVGSGLGGGNGGTVIINQPYPGTAPPSSGVPTYHYPPADSFGRDESLHGSITNDRPVAPDYSRVNPAPYGVMGQSGGTGGGTAASNKSTTASGQAGGSGAGSAASNKGGFANGESGFRAKSGASNVGGGGSGRSAGGSSGSRVGTSSSGISGGRSSGGFRGGSGGRRR